LTTGSQQKELVNTQGIELAKILDGNRSLKKVLTVLKGVK
jgi:hypothetical protein